MTVALGDAWVCTIVNTALYPATVDKTAESAVQDTTTGDWTVTYTLDVTNPNPDDPITYDLSDELRFPAAATVNGVTVTPPAGVTVNAGFDGDADQVIATGVALPAGATHTYTVVVDVTVTEPLPPPDRECETPGPGTGFDNLGTVTSYGQTDEDEACVDIPELPVPTVSKVVDGAPVQQPDGSWTITYTVAVNNPDVEFAAAYLLSDTLVFGGDITVNSSSVVSVNDPPLSTNPAWTGITPNTAVFVGPRLIGPGVIHNYMVTVNATVGADSTEADRDCDLEPGEEGTGFLNTATLTSRENTDDAEACTSPMSPTIDKTFESAEQHLGAGGIWDGTWDVTYTVTVDNASEDTDLRYSLSDTPGFPAGVTINGGTVTGEDNVGNPITVLNPAFTTVPVEIVAARPLLAAGADTYTVVVNATVPSDLDPGLQDCSDQGSGFGFFNASTVTSGADEITDDDCGPISPLPAPTVIKVVDGGVPVQQAGRLLDDRLHGHRDQCRSRIWPLCTRSPTRSSSAPASSSSRQRSTSAGLGQPDLGRPDRHRVFVGERVIAPDTTATYTVTVNAIVPTTVTHRTAGLRVRTGRPAPGSSTRRTLTSFAGTEHRRGLACAEPVSPTLDKTFVSAVQHLTAGIWDGTWDVTYTVAVANPSATTDLIYSLTDTPGFPPAVTINGGTVVGSDGTDPITVLNPTVPGSGTFGIVTDRSLPAGGTDTYTIVLNATVPADFDPALGECIENTPGNGFYNTSDATSGEDPFTDHDCGTIPQIPNPTVTKTVVGAPVQGANGAWTITYDVVATNPDATLGTLYDLTDTLAFGAGITVTSATVTGPSGVTVNPGWNGASDTTVILGRFLAGGASETYRVVVTATVASDATRTCDTGGFRNNSHVDLVVPTPPELPPALRAATGRRAPRRPPRTPRRAPSRSRRPSPRRWRR